VHEMLIVRGVFATRRQIMRRSSGGSLGNWWKVVVRAEDETSGGDWVGCKEAILAAEDTSFVEMGNFSLSGRVSGVPRGFWCSWVLLEKLFAAVGVFY
jgi:hypothetical protein